MSEMTRQEALAKARRLATGFTEQDETAALSRFLERTAGEAPEVRHVLLEVGARAPLTEARAPGGRPE